jgi:hypothetical protein
MKDWHDDRRVRHDVITIPVLWLAIALSLLVHVAALLGLLPRLPLLTHNAPSLGDEVSAPLTATLAGPSTPVPESRPPTVVAEAAPTPPPAPAPQPRPKPAPKPRVRTPPPPPPMTAPSAPVAIAPPVTPPPPPVEPTPEPPQPKPTPAPPATQRTPPADLSALIAERRRARGEPVESAGNTPDAPESDIARRDRIVAQNLASVNTRDFGKGTRNSGGIFQITKLGSSDAEFTFFGWNKDINRRAQQRIEVQQGSNPDIRIAIVREMIAIIRRYENEDFVWESRRLGRNITLSARAQDTRELENFMLREFFNDSGLRQ